MSNCWTKIKSSFSIGAMMHVTQIRKATKTACNLATTKKRHLTKKKSQNSKISSYNSHKKAAIKANLRQLKKRIPFLASTQTTRTIRPRFHSKQSTNCWFIIQIRLSSQLLEIKTSRSLVNWYSMRVNCPLRPGTLIKFQPRLTHPSLNSTYTTFIMRWVRHQLLMTSSMSSFTSNLSLWVQMLQIDSSTPLSCPFF